MHNEQRFHIRVDVLLVSQHIMCHEQTRRKRSLAADGDIHQCALGELHRVGGGEHQRSAVLLEDDQSHAVTALIGICQQREMAPFVAFMRSATAIDQEASTRKSTRFATRFTRILRCKSPFLMEKASFLRSSVRCFWKGAAARMVASKAISVRLSPAGRALM
jgi:hypothetical protein